MGDKVTFDSTCLGGFFEENLLVNGVTSSLSLCADAMGMINGLPT